MLVCFPKFVKPLWVIFIKTTISLFNDKLANICKLFLGYSYTVFVIISL